MRILLDAYFDNNFGDDLFVDTILTRYSDAMFYTFWRNTPPSVLRRAAEFDNLVIIPCGCVMPEGWLFDAYVMIGGDVLPDGVNYAERIARMQAVKKYGGFVAMLGFSLYTEYGEKTIADLKTMAELADSIVIRDAYSAERFQNLVPGAKVTASTDMVFTRRVKDIRNAEDTSILGIIPRRKLYSTDEEHLAYCRAQAAVADAYLSRNVGGKVRFLAFSTGEYDDRVTSRDIIRCMQVKDAENKTEIVSYEGSIGAFQAAISGCQALLPTRFHGLVFALICRKPFVPVPYEVKLTQLLDELNYTGIRVPYAQEIAQEQVEEVLKGLEQFAIAPEVLEAYEKKAAVFFEALDRWKQGYVPCWKEPEGAGKAQCVDAEGEPEGIARCTAGAACQELQNENELLKKQVEELNKWIAALQEQKDGFERQNQEMSRLREQQQQTIQELSEAITERGNELQQRDGQILLLENDKNMLNQQNAELMKWIESLKAERAAFERQNQELESIRQWQWDQLMRMPLTRGKMEREYNNFLQTLREKLDKQG